MGVKLSPEQLDRVKQRQPGLRVAAAERPAPVNPLSKALDHLLNMEVAPIARNSWSFTYSGQGLSLNQVFGRGHWTQRNEHVAKWHRIFKQLVTEAQVPKMERFKVCIVYKSRADPDNIVAMLKCAVDFLKIDHVPEDSPKYFKGFSIDVDDSLPHNTFVFTIISLS